EEQEGDTVVPLCPLPQTHPSLHLLLSTNPPTPPRVLARTPSDIFLPHLQEEQEVDTVVSIMYPFEGDNPPPLLLAEYDWEMDEYEEFTDNLVKDESLPEAEKPKFITISFLPCRFQLLVLSSLPFFVNCGCIASLQEYVKKEVKEAKLKAKKVRNT
ncbi:unnamed protein product, partial [Closterium sp. NIES-53]